MKIRYFTCRATTKDNAVYLIKHKESYKRVMHNFQRYNFTKTIPKDFRRNSKLFDTGNYYFKIDERCTGKS